MCYSSDSVNLLLGAKNSKFEFFWWDKIQYPQFEAQYKCFIIQSPPKVSKCHKNCRNFKFQFSRQKFKFEFFAPKKPNFSTSFSFYNFDIKQSCLNQDMPLIKVVQIGPLYS